jgi:hypothetical protein
MKHPIQPFESDYDGVIRFRPNMIVSLLLETSKFTLTDISRMPFSNDDYQQLIQLLGYTFSGYFELRCSQERKMEVNAAYEEFVKRSRE